MLRVVVADDEQYVLKRSVDLLVRAGAAVVASFTASWELLDWFKMFNGEIDAVFLDVNMPVIDGFAVADMLQELKPDLKVVFVSSYDEYAVKAFEINALDYIVKPLSQERLLKCLQRLQQHLAVHRQAGIICNGKETGLSRLSNGELKTQRQLRSVLLKKMSGRYEKEVLLFYGKDWEWVSKTAVACFGKFEKGSFVKVLANGRKYETLESLRAYLESFPQQEWLMCHRAIYINPEFVDKIEKNGRDESFVVLKGFSGTIPVSRIYFDQVLAAVKKIR